MSYQYTLYEWFSDDEGGFGVCSCGDFNPNLGYHPESGRRAKPSVKIGDFSSVDELVDLLLHDAPECFNGRSEAAHEARWIMSHCLPDDYD